MLSLLDNIASSFVRFRDKEEGFLLNAPRLLITIKLVCFTARQHCSSILFLLTSAASNDDDDDDDDDDADAGGGRGRGKKTQLYRR